MSTLYVALAIVGGLSVYITLAGIAFAVIPKSFDSGSEDGRLVVSGLWPLSLAVFVAWKLVMIGPRVAKWHQKQNSIPRAIARFEKEHQTP